MPREVVLVTGPPCGGKSTWVDQNITHGATVIDFDGIARNLGSTAKWDHDDDVRALAKMIRRDQEDALAADPNAHAYVIRSAADPRDRDAIARRLGATRVVVVDPGRVEAHRRAVADGRPNWTAAAIDRWYGITHSTADPGGSPDMGTHHPDMGVRMTAPQSSETPDEPQDVDTTPDGGEQDEGTEVDHKAEAEKWKALARKHEKQAKENAKAKSDLDKVKQESLSEQEKAIETARAETRAEVAREANEKAAMTILRANLQARGMTGDDLDEVLDTLSPSRLISDDDVDTDKVTRIATRLAGPMRAGGVDMGQGRRKQTPASKAEAGRAEAEKRFGPKAGSR